MKEEKVQQDSLKQLEEIHRMMENSSRFISLSGLSGVIAGIIALAGSAYAYQTIQAAATAENPAMLRLNMHTISYSTMLELVILGISMIVVAVGFGIALTVRKASQKGQNIWGSSSRKLLLALMLPLVAGGLFCMGLLHHQLFGLIAPATLLFYGLALLNASKYTLREIKMLAYSEMILGIISIYFIGYGLLFWAIGFGALHIFYGIIMHLKYDRK